VREHDDRVAVLGTGDVPEVVDTLCESFYDYPVMTFVLGRRADYSGDLKTLINFFVMARVLRDEVVLGVRGDRGLEATALVSYPGARDSPPELGELRERVWAQLGKESRARYEAFGSACATFEVAAPHIHLNMIGVRTSAQGRGLGRELLEAVHRMSADNPASTGVALSTEHDRNVPLYEHFGYTVVGEARVGEAFTTRVMFRPDP
jgi:GNAT superfamily N-acetyltransferase